MLPSTPMNRHFTIAFLALAAPAALGDEELTTEQINFFEKKIRPAMAEYCYQCHCLHIPVQCTRLH